MNFIKLQCSKNSFNSSKAEQELRKSLSEFDISNSQNKNLRMISDPQVFEIILAIATTSTVKTIFKVLNNYLITKDIKEIELTFGKKKKTYKFKGKVSKEEIKEIIDVIERE